MGVHLHHIMLHNIKILKYGVEEQIIHRRHHNLAIIQVTITEINVFAFKKESKIYVCIWIILFYSGIFFLFLIDSYDHGLKKVDKF